MAAAHRSFTTPAVITLVLYFILWIPGVIANILYWREANNVQQLTGHAPEGKGCLVAMFWLFGPASVLLLCIFLVLLF